MRWSLEEKATPATQRACRWWKSSSQSKYFPKGTAACEQAHAGTGTPLGWSWAWERGWKNVVFFPKVCKYLFPFSFVYYNAYQTVNIYCNLQQINFPKSSQLVLWQKSVSDFPVVVKPWPFLLLFSVFSTSISLNTETEWPNRALSFALVVIEISLIPGPAGQKWRHAFHHPFLTE